MDALYEANSLEGVPDTLYALLRLAVEHHPDQHAIICPHQAYDLLPGFVNRDHTQLSLTYSQLWNAAGSLASVLAPYDLLESATVVIFSYNCAEWALTLWTAIRMGLPFVPLDPRNIGSVSQIVKYLEISKPGVLVVANDGMASELEASHAELLRNIKVKILLSTNREDHKKDHEKNLVGWSTLNALLAPPASDGYICDDEVIPNTTMDETALIVFTSGTTSLPKACAHSNKNIWAATSIIRLKSDLDPSRKLLQNLPNSHIFSFVGVLAFWANGATVIYPSYTFDAESSLRALQLYKCTDIRTVPSTLLALQSHPHFNRRCTASITYHAIGGSIITPAIMEAARSPERFGVPNSCLGFGMSEGTPIIGAGIDEELVVDEGILTNGKAQPGCRVKICHPESRQILKRGQIGELHMGGLPVIKAYLDGPSDSFYVDEAGRDWLATGDQAKMHDSGAIFILGRYKDIIIKGGENISAAVIEAALDQCSGITSQVIAVREETAGEVPVAIIRTEDGHDMSKNQLLDHVRKVCGPTLVPSMILTIDEIGLQSFPRTTTGKVRKAELRQIVDKYLNDRDSDLSENQEERALSKTEATLVSIWAQMIGRTKETIPIAESMSRIADSITFMRVRHKIRNLFGKDISIEDLMDPGGIKFQAVRIEEQPTFTVITARARQRDGPPRADDMVHAGGDVKVADQIKHSVVPILENLHLTWEDDVEDVLPVSDFGSMLVQRKRPQTWNHRHAFVVPNIPPNEVQQALQNALSRHSILRTLAVHMQDGTFGHVVIRPSSRWFSHCFSNLSGVDVADELRNVSLDDPNLDFVAAPGPLFRVMIVPVNTPPNSTGFVYQIQHSIFDAFSISMFLEDVNLILSDKTSVLVERVPYKVYADMYHNHYTSTIARRGVEVLAAKYRGISNIRSALWPFQKAPGWFKGNDTGWTRRDGTPGMPSERKPIDGLNARGLYGFSKIVKFKHLFAMSDKFGIEPVIIFKTALALLNTAQTGQTTALFYSSQAARVWPFIEEYVQNRLPDPMDIPGPTWECVVNVIKVMPDESIGDLLKSVAMDQNILTQWAHTPIRALRESLNRDDGDVLMEAMSRQLFNWLPIQANPSAQQGRKIQHVQTLSRADVGIQFNCRLSEAETLTMVVTYDDAQLGSAEVHHLLDEYFSISQWISDPDNYVKPTSSWKAGVKQE